MPHYHERIEYDAEHNLLTLRGINFSLRPYAIEIRGAQAGVWFALLRATSYFHRKANGSAPKEEIENDCNTSYPAGDGGPDCL